MESNMIIRNTIIVTVDHPVQMDPVDAPNFTGNYILSIASLPDGVREYFVGLSDRARIATQK